MTDSTWKAFDKNVKHPIKYFTDMGYDCRVGFIYDYVFERKTTPLNFLKDDKGETKRIEFRYGCVEIDTKENETNRTLPIFLTFDEIKAIYEVRKMLDEKK